MSDLVSAYIFYEVDNPIDSWPEFLGLRPKDIPKGIWAVLPYSWVVDRFVNISSSIGALTNLLDPGVHVLGAAVSHKISRTTSYRAYGAYAPAPYVHSCSGDTLAGVTEIRSRALWTPSLSDIVPSFQMDPDLSHWGDLAALVVQRLRT